MLPLSDNELDQLVREERERGAPPRTDWDSLATRLKAEGLIRTRTFAGLTTRTWMQAAAAVLLVAGGAMIGRVITPQLHFELVPGTASGMPLLNG